VWWWLNEAASASGGEITFCSAEIYVIIVNFVNLCSIQTVTENNGRREPVSKMCVLHDAADNDLCSGSVSDLGLCTNTHTQTNSL